MSNWAKMFSPVKNRTKPVGPVAEFDPKSESILQGLKRKVDPYEIPDAEEESHVATPASRPRSYRSNGTPSSAKSKPSANKAKRPPAGGIRSSIGSAQCASQPTTEAQVTREDGEPRVAPRAPMADMGGSELLVKQPNTTENPPTGKPIEEDVAAQRPAKDKTIQGESTGQGALELPAKEIEGESIHEIKKLLKHKASEKDAGQIVLLVQWMDDPVETWEPEEEIQNGASETLFEYWKKQGGRSSALFEKGSQSPFKEQYWVYKILNHRRIRSMFHFEVQWVGYPIDKVNTSIEPESKLKKIANELLDEYWATKGGRDQFLARRGRAKKPRTE